jgi:hypothetical protein
LKTHRDQVGRAWLVWVRRALLTLLAVAVVAGLLNAFGQRPATSHAAAAQARLTVYAPLRARSGVIYAARFRIDALEELKNATLILAPGWAEQYTVNGASPQPVTQGSSNGRLVFGFGHVPSGRHITFWLSLQVNPTNVGHRSQTVVLADGDTPIATVHRTITIFP